MTHWTDFFNDRQLLSLGTFSEVLREMKPKIRESMDADRAEALLAYLAIALDKAVIYNSVAGTPRPQPGHSEHL